MSYQTFHVTGGVSMQSTLSVSDSTSGASAFPSNVWVDVAVVHASDGKASIFWDGALVASGNVALPAEVPRRNLYIGRGLSFEDTAFHGKISDVMLFQYAFTIDELAGL